MSRLLHIDTSIRYDGSVSRRLTALAADRWRATHPGGTLTYRDFAVDALPHLNVESGLARMIPPEQHTPAQAASYALSVELIDEVKAVDTILLGLPLYNYGPPSTVQAWVDHLVAAGLSVTPDMQAGLLGDTELIVLAARGGGYGPGTPREGWDHAQSWLPHGLALTGLVPRFITAELTLADSNPALAELKPLAAASRQAAEAEIGELWSLNQGADSDVA
jgi:FMN-dependent NADH-azoreductase